MSKQKLLRVVIVLAITMTIGTMLGILDIDQHLAFATGQSASGGLGGAANHQGIGQSSIITPQTNANSGSN